MVKNPADNAGDMGLMPGLGRSYILQSSEAYVPRLLRACAITVEDGMPTMLAL